MTANGKLWGVGLGPGDSELVTIKAARLIGEAPVIAYHCARHGNSIARSVASPYLLDGQIEERLMYPVTTETTDHPRGYTGALADFYTESAARLAEHLRAGRDVVLLAEGDPLFFSSYMHMHKRLVGEFDAEFAQRGDQLAVHPHEVLGLVEQRHLDRGVVALEELVVAPDGPQRAEVGERELDGSLDVAELGLGAGRPEQRHMQRQLLGVELGAQSDPVEEAADREVEHRDAARRYFLPCAATAAAPAAAASGSR